jgi:hypothetical protein
MKRTTLAESLSMHSIVRKLKCLFLNVFFILIATLAAAQDSINKPLRKGNIGGYMITRIEKVDDAFNAGYSMYAAAWPLVKAYPGRSFQSGLFGTWMHPQHDGPLPVEKLYTDIEGGLGWWRAIEFFGMGQWAWCRQGKGLEQIQR